MQRLNHGKRSAEARAVAAENAAQHAQHELAALKMLTASMLAQTHGGAANPYQELESIESVKPGSTLQASSSVVDTLTQQKGSSVRAPFAHLYACSSNAPHSSHPFHSGLNAQMYQVHIWLTHMGIMLHFQAS